MENKLRLQFCNSLYRMFTYNHSVFKWHKNISMEKFRNSIIYKRFIGLTALVVLYISPVLAQDFNEEKAIPEDAVVYMERTQCYGDCPVYKVYVLEDGNAYYFGKQNVEKKGVYKASVSPEEMEDLISLFKEYEFFEFEKRYVDMISDLPTTYIYFSNDGESKKITDYHGAPEKLKKLEKEVDVFVQSLPWEKVDNDNVKCGEE